MEVVGSPSYMDSDTYNLEADGTRDSVYNPPGPPRK